MNFYHQYLILYSGQVRLFPGRKLDFEPKHCKNWKNESDFVTLVSFSVEYPYGKALAMLNLKNNFLMVCLVQSCSLHVNAACRH